MKANVKEAPTDVIVVRGVELPFNCMNENHLRKLQAIGEEIGKEHPRAMELGIDPSVISDAGDPAGIGTIADMYAEGTAVFCALFDRLFGDGTSAKLFGPEPYYSLCLEVYYEFLAAVEQQGVRAGQKVQKTIAKYAPVGPKGNKK